MNEKRRDWRNVNKMRGELVWMYGEIDRWMICQFNDDTPDAHGVYTVTFISAAGEKMAKLTLASFSPIPEYKAGRRYIIHVMPDTKPEST